jgi:hypothetical protein
MRNATDQIRGFIDEYVRRSFEQSENSERLQMRLRSILGDHRLNPEYADLPFAKVLDLRDGREHSPISANRVGG